MFKDMATFLYILNKGRRRALLRNVLLLIPGIAADLFLHSGLVKAAYLSDMLTRFANVYIAVISVLIFNSLLLSFMDIYSASEKSRNHPLKALIQGLQVALFFVGGIVVGTTAAEAGLLSPMALIVVSIAAICGFVIPNRDFASAVRVCRFGLTVIAAICGLVGIVFGFAALLMHLLTLRSMGVPYLIIGNPGLIRRRLKMEKFRSKYLNPQDKRNQK